MCTYWWLECCHTFFVIFVLVRWCYQFLSCAILLVYVFIKLSSSPIDIASLLSCFLCPLSISSCGLNYNFINFLWCDLNLNFNLFMGTFYLYVLFLLHSMFDTLLLHFKLCPLPKNLVKKSFNVFLWLILSNPLFSIIVKFIKLF